MYDPLGNDLNKYTDLKSRKAKNNLVVKMWQEYGGKIIKAVHLQTGEVREFEIPPQGSVKGRMGRVNIIYLLFGDWRIATPEQVAKQEKLNRDKAMAIAEKEAARLGGASGLIFREMATAAKVITDLNAATVAASKAAEKTDEEELVEVGGKKKGK